MDFVTDQNASETHPERHRPPYRSSVSKTLVALFGAPLAWIIQMSLSEPIAAYACYPHEVPLSAPLWVELRAILAAIGLVCLAAGLLSAYVAWTFWRHAGSAHILVTHHGSDREDALVDGGQNRFLAMTGVMSSTLFVIAILFTCFAVFLVSPCSAWT
jgi:hypothetical protein